jgi:cell division protein FtsQ
MQVSVMSVRESTLVEPALRGSRGRLGRTLRRGTVTGRIPAFVLAVGLSVLLAGFLGGRDYTVRSVVVYGNELAFVDAVVADSGALGQPLFWLDTAAVARRVAGHPAVIEAKVRAVFPDTVVIQLRERIPVAVWVQEGQAVLVDPGGWVIAAADRPGLPRVTQKGGTLPTPGDRLPVATVQAAVGLSQRFGARVEEFEFDPRGGLSVRLEGGRVVRFGAGERLAEQLRVLEAIEQAGVQWGRLDLSDPDRPVFW